MKVYKLDKATGKKEFVKYPRKDMKPMIGLDSNIVYFLTIDEDKPEYDPDTQELKYVEKVSDKPHPEYSALRLGRGSWKVINKPLPELSVIQEKLLDELKELRIEIAGIVSNCKNLYDPLRESPEELPVEFKKLVRLLLKVSNRVKKDIKGFTDPKLAIKYKIRTKEAEYFINKLNEFLL